MSRIAFLIARFVNYRALVRKNDELHTSWGSHSTHGVVWNYKQMPICVMIAGEGGSFLRLQSPRLDKAITNRFNLLLTRLSLGHKYRFIAGPKPRVWYLRDPNGELTLWKGRLVLPLAPIQKNSSQYPTIRQRSEKLLAHGKNW